MNRKSFLTWAERELGIRYPARAVSGKNRHYRQVLCAKGMYLGVDALAEGEMRVHVFTDTSAPRLKAACVTLPPAPRESRFTLRNGSDDPERQYAGFSWQHTGDDYAQEREKVTRNLDWLEQHVVSALAP